MPHRPVSPARPLFSRLTAPLLLAAALLLGGVLAGCDASGDEGGGETFIEGTVLDAATGDTLAGARITVTPPGEVLAESGSDGFFSARVDLDSTMQVDLMVEKDGYAPTSRSIRAEPGGVESVGTISVPPGEGGTGEPAVITGTVNRADGTPAQNARVTTDAGGETYSARVNAEDGSYRLEPRLSGSAELTVRAVSDDLSSQRVITVFAGDTRSDIDFVLGSNGDDDGDGDEQGPPGTPSNILLQEVSRTTIGIQGSGSSETARVTYQVADSSGQGVSLDDATPVRFELSGASPDGAFVAPRQATTGDDGLVTVNISSGQQSGTVQVVATAETSDGEVIESKPVTITIHGGLPDQAHFSISPARANFQGLVTNGLTIPVEVIVGDRFSNPVKPGTAIYFESTHGIIEGSATTDEQGRGTVEFISGNPKPDADGVSVITASTQNRDEERIEVKTPVLFTTRGILKVVSIPTQTFDEPLDLREPADVQTLKDALGSDFPFGGYEFVVEDRNGNPLPQDATVGFTAGGTEVGASGDTNVTLGDTQFIDDEGDGFDYEDVERGFGITRFSAAATRANDPTTADLPDLKSVTFRFTGPQGQRAYTFSEPQAGGEAPSVTVRKNGEPIARF